jgi:predicted nucleic acid-binding protein
MLVDTSVWIDHFHRPHAALVTALERGEAECHDFVIGELACGTLPRRDEVLTLMRALPRISPVTQDEALALVAARRLWGRGLGWVDVGLLAATLVAGGRLWTMDRRLRAIAHDLGVAREVSCASLVFQTRH